MAGFVIALVSLYVAVGVLCAIVFVWHGIEQVDPVAHGAPWSFRLLIFPGAAAIWPFLMWRWFRVTHNRGES